MDISVNIADTDPDNREEFVVLAFLSLISYFEKWIGDELPEEWSWNLQFDRTILGYLR